MTMQTAMACQAGLAPAVGRAGGRPGAVLLRRPNTACVSQLRSSGSSRAKTNGKLTYGAGATGRRRVVRVAALGQGFTLVPISTQLDLTLPLSPQLKLSLSPVPPKLPRRCSS